MVVDVTGFGLLGHLTEMCEASDTTAHINFANVPRLDATVIDDYLEKKCIPGGTDRNWDSYGHKIGKINDHQRNVLCDPQTSGGLLVAVDDQRADDFVALASKRGLTLASFGEMSAPGAKQIEVS